MSTLHLTEGQVRPAPFSLRLSFEERGAIERAAGDQPVAAYIKSVLFGAERPRATRTRSPVRDQKALAEVLACLGASRLSNNLNQLAKHANQGNLYFDHDTMAALCAACEDVRAMRQLLMAALGMKQGSEPPARESASQCFARASAPKRFTL